MSYVYSLFYRPKLLLLSGSTWQEQMLELKQMRLVLNAQAFIERFTVILCRYDGQHKMSL